MKHILNNLTEQEKQSILEQHKGGMKVVNENFSKLIKATLGDAKPLVSEQDDKKDTHRYETGTQTPGIEKFMENPSDETVSNGLLNQLRNDPFGKGKIVIIFNGEKFKEPGAFMFKIQRDSKSGICYKITSYEYNNRILINTQIKITAEVVECKKQNSPVKPPVKPPVTTDTTTIPPKKPKKFCKHKMSIPFEGEVKMNERGIRRFQEFCSTFPAKNVWVREYSDGTTVPCTSKDVDGKWGCCSQTCYVKTRKQPIPRPKPRPGDDEDYRGDAEPSKNIPGSDCPKSVNCMPGPGQRDSICKNPKVLEMCKRLGTKVYY